MRIQVTWSQDFHVFACKTGHVLFVYLSTSATACPLQADCMAAGCDTRMHAHTNAESASVHTRSLQADCVASLPCWVQPAHARMHAHLSTCLIVHGLSAGRMCGSLCHAGCNLHMHACKYT